VISRQRLRHWLIAAAIALGLALPVAPSCSGARSGRRHSSRVHTERSKKPRHVTRVRSRHPRHQHPHAHPHPYGTHHHHPHPHPHLDGPDGHHHPY